MSQKEDDVEYLSKLRQRMVRGEKALAGVDEITFGKPFKDIKYESEALKVCKLIQKE